MKLLFFTLSLFLVGSAAAQPTFSDAEDYRRAHETLSAAAPGDNGSAVISARHTLLLYHQRRWDPDSILTAADALLAVAQPGSREMLAARYNRTLSLLLSYRIQAYEASVAENQRMIPEWPDSMEALVRAHEYLVIGFYEFQVGDNYERQTVALNAALEETEISPELRNRAESSMCYAIGRMGQYEAALFHYNRFRDGHNGKGTDELDALKILLMRAALNFELERFPHSLQLAKKLIGRIAPYRAQLPYLTARALQVASRAQYRIDKNEQCLAYIEEAIALRDLPEFYQDHVGILYHLGRHDRTIAVCQRIITENVAGFTPTTIYDNPAAEATITYGKDTEDILMWKSRAMYKKSFNVPPEEAFNLLEGSIATGEIGRRYNNRLLFAAEGFYASQMIIIRQTSYGLGYQMRAAYELSHRRGRPEDFQRLFRYMEMRKNFLLSPAFSAEYLPVALQRERKARITAFEDAEIRHWQASQEKPGSFPAEELVDKMQAMETFLARTNQQYPRPITDHSQVNFANPDDIQRSLDSTTVFIQYASQWQHHYAYVITADEQHAFKVHETFDHDIAVKGLVKLLSSPLSTQKFQRNKLIKRSRGLYDDLLAPFDHLLEGKRKLIIVPERDLYNLPFEVLLPPGANAGQDYTELPFLLKDFEISYHYSGTFYTQLREKASVTDGSFLGFAPVFENGGDLTSPGIAGNRYFKRRMPHRSIRGNNFTPLPGTEREIRTIAGMLDAETPRSTLLVRKAATTTALQNQLTRPYQFVHIATHGLNSFRDPRLSALACYDESGASGAFFLARSAESLDIQADLTVLSSCESGLGLIIEGENLIALNRSFLAAGSRNILYSLWKIDDESSSDLMIRFYRQYLTGKSYAASLRAAKLELLRNPATAAPRHWAAFVLMGE